MFFTGRWCCGVITLLQVNCENARVIITDFKKCAHMSSRLLPLDPVDFDEAYQRTSARTAIVGGPYIVQPTRPPLLFKSAVSGIRVRSLYPDILRLERIERDTVLESALQASEAVEDLIRQQRRDRPLIADATNLNFFEKVPQIQALFDELANLFAQMEYKLSLMCKIASNIIDALQQLNETEFPFYAYPPTSRDFNVAYSVEDVRRNLTTLAEINQLANIQKTADFLWVVDSFMAFYLEKCHNAVGFGQIAQHIAGDRTQNYDQRLTAMFQLMPTLYEKGTASVRRREALESLFSQADEKGAPGFGWFLRHLLPGLVEQLRLLSDLDLSLSKDATLFMMIHNVMNDIPLRIEYGSPVNEMKRILLRSLSQRTNVVLANAGNIASRLLSRQVGFRQ